MIRYCIGASIWRKFSQWERVPTTTDNGENPPDLRGPVDTIFLEMGPPFVSFFFSKSILYWYLAISTVRYLKVRPLLPNYPTQRNKPCLILEYGTLC